MTALVGAPQLKVIATVLNGDIQSLLNLAQMTVQLPTKGCQITGVIGFEGESDM